MWARALIVRRCGHAGASCCYGPVSASDTDCVWRVGREGIRNDRVEINISIFKDRLARGRKLGGRPNPARTRSSARECCMGVDTPKPRFNPGPDGLDRW
jgi:hypothetical protein